MTEQQWQYLAETVPMIAYGASIALGIAWAVWRFLLYRKTERHDEARLSEMMTNEQFKAYLQSLRAEHEAEKAKEEALDEHLELHEDADDSEEFSTGHAGHAATGGTHKTNPE